MSKLTDESAHAADPDNNPRPKVGVDRGPLTHDFELLDLPACAAIELHMDSTGKVWFNVNNKCLFRAGAVARIEITDNRKRKKRSN